MLKSFLRLTFLCALIFTSTLNSSCRRGEVKKTTPVISESTHLLDQLNDKVLISAHRGGKALLNHPENCLETMQLLYDQKINLFEIDIRTTQDRKIVLLHDKSLDRTTDATDLVSRYKWDELRKIKLVDDYGNPTSYAIPDLESVLEWASNKKVVLQLDLKAVDLDQLAVLINKKECRDQIVLISYSLDQALKLHEKFPDFMLSVPMRNEEEYLQLIRSGIPHERMIAFTGTRLSSSDLYRKIRSHGIRTILGTLGNLDKRVASKGPELYLEYARKGIDIIATDRPLAAKHVFLHSKKTD